MVVTTQVYCQSSCPNSDFESGTLNGWQGQIGNCCPIVTSPSGIVNGRHTVMSGTGTDPNTCGVVHVVSPGGLYSARVGNEDVNSEAETLSYTLTVTPSSSLFIYKYAVVLQDPGHVASEQPRFEVKVLNAAGQLIDPTCGQYTVVASSSLAGFQTCPNPNGDIRYRDWTTVGLNLSSFLGQTLTIEFETGDCDPGAHFGYAYVDAYCSPLQIGASYCSGSFAAQLTAPVGFNYLWNTGETTQTILVTNPTAGLNYSCTLTSVTGCSVVISTVLQLEDPTADFKITNTCYNNAVFEDSTVLNNTSLLDSYHWDFGDGTTATVQNPTHSFPATGTYTVKFTTFNAFGCTTTATRNITVYNTPTAQITYGRTNFCTSETGIIPVQLTGTDLYTGGTYNADVSGLSLNAATGEITPATSLAGTYVVTYTIPTANGCTVPPVITTITIFFSPTATISYADPFCRSISAPQPVTLIGTGAFSGGIYSGPNGVLINALTGALNPRESTVGTHQILYTIPASLGCTAAPVYTTVTILPLPEPLLTNFTICEDPRGLVFRPALLNTGLSDLNYSCQWFFNGTPVIGVTSNQYAVSVVGNYSVLITDLGTGCISPQTNMVVSTSTTVEDFITYVTNTFIDNNILTVLVEGGTGPYLFSIDGLPFQASNIFTQLSPGIHIVNVTDVTNCTDVSKRVMVLGYPEYFTPNGDGINDFWNIYYFDAHPNARIYIYDRYGKMLKQLSPQSPGWDGTYNGSLMPSSDYWFQVEFKDYDEKGKLVWQNFKSHFSMVR